VYFGIAVPAQLECFGLALCAGPWCLSHRYAMSFVSDTAGGVPGTFGTDIKQPFDIKVSQQHTTHELQCATRFDSCFQSNAHFDLEFIGLRFGH
jgi:hypothetical protein